DNKISDNQRKPEGSLHPIVTNTDQIGQVLVGERLDPMRIPRLPRPEPVPPWTTQKCADNNRGHPQDLETEQKGENFVLSFLEGVVPVAFRINVNVGDDHKAD